MERLALLSCDNQVIHHRMVNHHLLVCSWFHYDLHITEQKRLQRPSLLSTSTTVKCASKNIFCTLVSLQERCVSGTDTCTLSALVQCKAKIEKCFSKRPSTGKSWPIFWIFLFFLYLDLSSIMRSIRSGASIWKFSPSFYKNSVRLASGRAFLDLFVPPALTQCGTMCDWMCFCMTKVFQASFSSHQTITSLGMRIISASSRAFDQNIVRWPSAASEWVSLLHHNCKNLIGGSVWRM